MADAIKITGIWQDNGDYHFADDAGSARTGEMNPVELLTAALVSCTGRTMQTILGRMKIKHEGFTITGLAGFADDEPVRVSSISLEASIRGAAVSDAQKNRLMELTEKYCPVSQTLQRSVDIGLGIEA